MTNEMKKSKHVYNKTTGRSYKEGSYDDNYGERTVDDRSQRNQARAEMKSFLTEKYGAKRAKDMMRGKDVDHIKSIKHGGSNSIKNLRLISPKKNRGRKEK